MKKKFKNAGALACLAILFLFVSDAFAPWRYNPFTRKLDYYSMDVGGALTGEAAGDILYHNGTNWTNLAVGANTNVLTVAAGLPSWAAAGAPGAHAATHELLGADLVDHDNLTNFVAGEHLAVGAIDHDSLLNYVAGQHIGLPNTIATVLSDWDADLDTYAGITPSANIQTFLGAANYAAMRTQLGLVIGTNVQAWDTDLDTYAGISPSANVQTLLGNATFALFMADLSGTAGAAFAWNGQNITGLNSIYLVEQAEADADIAGSGQIWVDAGSPNTLWFTDEDGTDLQLGVGADAFTLKVDAGATADYFGVAGGDGLFRFTANHFTMADGGNFVTLSLADHATARTALGLAIGTDVQAQNAVLTELTALADPGADEFPFWNDTTNNFEFSTVLFPTATGVTIGAAGNAGKLELEDADADVLAIQVGVQAGNTTYTWPTAFGTTGFVLASTDAGVMSWARRQTWDADLDTYAGITPSANVQTLLANATFALFLADLSATAGAAFDWNAQNLTNIGSIAPTSIDCGGVITAASYIGIEDMNELRFYEGVNYVGFEAGALGANQIWILPAADGANTQVMQTDGAGTLTWVANSSGTMATDALWAAQGDLAYGNADDVGVILSFNYDGDILRLNATVPYWDTPGIANTNPVVIDDDNVADDEYARFTASGLESRTPAEVMTTLPAATTGAPGKSELTTTAEVSAGTDTTRAVTADSLAGSTIGRKSMVWKLTANDEVIVDQDDYDSILVPADFAGWLITGVAARIVTADDGADFIDVGIYNVTQTAEILSTLMRIEATEFSTLTSAQPGVIDVGEDDITAADVIRIDVDYAGDNCTGLEVHITFERVT